jgi:hypothetical protein
LVWHQWAMAHDQYPMGVVTRCDNVLKPSMDTWLLSNLTEDTPHNSGRISVNLHNKIRTMSCPDRLVYTVAILYIYSRDNNIDDRRKVVGCIIFREGVSHSLQWRRNIVYLSQILFRSQVRNNLYASIKHMLQWFFPRYLSALLKLRVYKVHLYCFC